MQTINHGVSRGDTYFMIMTPTKLVNGIHVGRLIAPFLTKADAEDAAALLNYRYPDSKTHVGASQYTVDHDVNQLEKLYREACGDLAAELANIPMRKLQ